MAAVFGINLNRSCLGELKRGTKHLQPTRGDKHGGFSILVQDEIRTQRDEGSIERLFKKALSDDPTLREGQMAIGGVGFQDSQPIFIEKSGIGPFAIVGDVKIINKDELRREYPYLVGSDIEICGGLVAGGKDPVKGLEIIFKKVEGRYNLVLLTLEGIFACRDPWGFRSLAIARNESGCCAVASESAALGAAFDEIEIITEVKPGEIIQVESTGFKSLKSVPQDKLIICPFDIGYGQGPASIFEDIGIGLARFNMGIKLAQKYAIEADIVFPFPLSGNSAGEGYAFESKIPLVNVWQYNPLGRSYLAVSPEERRERGIGKYSPILWAIKDFKNLIGVDDSIVEANQLLARLFLLHRLMEKFHPTKGECALHLRIACPPKINSCPLEVPFRPKEKLFAASRNKETMRKELRLESLEFNTLDDFIDSILSAQSEKRKEESPIKPENLCLCCFTGESLTEKYFK